MAKKKRKQVQTKPWCWYCEREFEDEKVLITHQRAKHFKCPQCNKKMNTVGGLVIHYTQVHKETLRSTPNAIKGRDSVDVEIFGMEGIPAADLISFQMRKAASGEPNVLEQLHQQQQQSLYKRPRMNTDLHQPLSPDEIREQLARHQAIIKNGGSVASTSTTTTTTTASTSTTGIVNPYGNAMPPPPHQPYYGHPPPPPPGHFAGPPHPMAPFGGPPMQGGFPPHPPPPHHMPQHNPFGGPPMQGGFPPHPPPPGALYPMHAAARPGSGIPNPMMSPTAASVASPGLPPSMGGPPLAASTPGTVAASAQGTPMLSSGSEQTTPAPATMATTAETATSPPAMTSAGSVPVTAGTHLVYSDNTVSVEEKRANLPKYRYVEAH